MVEGEFAFKLNEFIYKIIDKLEIRFPEFREAYSLLGR